ncbi:MAG: NADH-quinone oxidoreductase subunit I [candidate division WS2 bacterium]|nr:NADH-quinone oxidoreductase subunit I [Candidatus Lithacetigena glycinireducens]
MLKSKLKEALICIKAGVVTSPFPLGEEPNPPGELFRGKVEVDVEKCIGCGGCANACPAGVIRIKDDGDKRIIEYDLYNCVYCGRCAEVCPENAILNSKEYQISTNKKEDLFIHNEINMGTCERCGRCFDVKSKSSLDKLMVKGPIITEEAIEPIRWFAKGGKV